MKFYNREKELAILKNIAVSRRIANDGFGRKKAYR